MTFEEKLRKILNSISETITLSSGNAIHKPPTDEGDDGDNGKEDWDELFRRFGESLTTWCGTSGDARKIFKSILEVALERDPISTSNIKDAKLIDEEDNSYLISGSAELYLSWEYNTDTEEFEVFIEDMLKKSDIWKVFKLQPNQLWEFIDRDNVLDFIIAIMIRYMTYRDLYTGDRYSKFENLISFRAFEVYKASKRNLDGLVYDTVYNEIANDFGQFQKRPGNIHYIDVNELSPINHKKPRGYSGRSEWVLTLSATIDYKFDVIVDVT